MQLLEAIEKRHSYRGEFQDTAVPRGDLERILQAGLAAPSGCNRQTTQLIGVEDKALIAQFAELLGLPKTAGAQAAVCVLYRPEPAVDGKSYAVQDYAAATQNLLLAITALGYATVWLEGQVHADGVAQRMENLLKVPSGVSLAVYLPFGVPAGEGPRVPRKPFGERAWFNTYGG